MEGNQQRSAGAAAQIHHVLADGSVTAMATHLAAECLCPSTLALVLDKLDRKALHCVAAWANLLLDRLPHWVVIAAVQMPVPAFHNPTFASPALQDTQAVQMTSNAPKSAP